MTLWQRLLYDSVYGSLYCAFTLLYSFRTVGCQHMPRTGPVLIVANHQSFLDPILTGLASQRRITWLARKSLFRSKLFRILTGPFRPVGIDIDGFSREGLRATQEVLEKGGVISLFPEGERTHDGRILPFKPGVALLHRRIPVPVVPMGIAGAFQAWPRTRSLPTFSPLFLRATKATIAVSVGKVLPVQALTGLSREAVLETLRNAVIQEWERAEHLRRQERN